MQNIFKKSAVVIAIAITNLCSAQLKEYDLAVIKHYPPITKKLVNPQAFTYKSNKGIVLQYQLSEGDYYRNKVDSLAAINKLDVLDNLDAAETYTDGAMNAWVEGSFKINNITYLLYGSYAGEGYLQGGLYDKNKVLYGLLEWESGNNITATLKTKTSTFKYNLTNGKQYPKPSIPKNDALETLLENRKINEIEPANIEANYGTGSGVTAITKKFKPELYLNDLQAIDTLSTLFQKREKLKEWGWVINKATESNGSKYINISYVVEKDNEIKLQAEFADPNNANAKMKFQYKVSNCRLKYIEGFVNDAKNKGYKIVEDKKAFYKMQNAGRVIVINKSLIHNNEQYFKIEVM